MKNFDEENMAGLGSREELGEGGRLSRREMLKIMGISALLPGALAGCERKPRRKIVSQTIMPEYMAPGEPLYYCSTWTEGRYPYGMIVKTVDGRPIKIDGNPAHPLNRGASTAAMQASLLGLYDPDRLSGPMRGGKTLSWGEADKEIVKGLRGGGAVVLMTRSTLGPSEQALIQKLEKILPQLRHFVYEPFNDELRRRVWRGIYGGNGDLLPHFDKARIILSLDSDFLGNDGATLETARQFAEGRRPTVQAPEMSRLYVAEGVFSVTGGNADHRIRLRPSEMEAFADFLLRAIGGSVDSEVQGFAKARGMDPATLEALLRDLRGNKGKALVVAGPHLGESVHATVALLNESLGAHGETLSWSVPGASLPVDAPGDIAGALDRGVDALICLGVNPVYDWPGGDFAALMKKARLSVGHSLLLDETLGECGVALSSAHNLESWNDASPRPGVWTPCQPVIAPLVSARQEAESLFVWAKALAPSDADLAGCKDWHDFVQLQWRQKVYPVSGSPFGFDDFWEGCLRSGVISLPAAEQAIRLNKSQAESLRSGAGALSIAKSSDFQNNNLELLIRPHYSLDDGRFANNAWLQELPDPISKIVWDSVAAVSSATARKLGVERGDLVEIVSDKARTRMPILVQPGMVDGLIATSLGHGRAKGGRFGTGAGFSVAGLVGSNAGSHAGGNPFHLASVKVSKTGEAYDLVASQVEDSMRDRPIILGGTLDQFRQDPRFVSRLRNLPKPVMIHEEYSYLGYKWGMAIDLNACQGCGGCIVACQAENNSPAVGKKEVHRGHWMHWLRQDRYYVGDGADVGILHQLVACQHCENAPCENVCPVVATTHSPEGINEMTYNRCVGTRYCSNNCPWKVRRFNFFDFSKRFSGDSKLTLAHNPNVTVRSVGVMEKCTYCIQRINEAKFKAKREGRSVVDGDIQTACQQACPVGAISFGNLNDPKSVVAGMALSERAYHVLEQLHTKPRTIYLAKVWNAAEGTREAGRILDLQKGIKGGG